MKYIIGWIFYLIVLVGSIYFYISNNNTKEGKKSNIEDNKQNTETTGLPFCTDKYIGLCIEMKVVDRQSDELETDYGLDTLSNNSEPNFQIEHIQDYDLSKNTNSETVMYDPYQSTVIKSQVIKSKVIRSTEITK